MTEDGNSQFADQKPTRKRCDATLPERATVQRSLSNVESDVEKRKIHNAGERAEEGISNVPVRDEPCVRCEGIDPVARCRPPGGGRMKERNLHNPETEFGVVRCLEIGSSLASSSVASSLFRPWFHGPSIVSGV